MSPQTSRRSLVIGAAALPTLTIPAFATADVAAEPDPTFALIEAHRAAFAVFAEAIKRADEAASDNSAHAYARGIVGYEKDIDVIKCTDAAGTFARCQYNGKTLPIYAYSPYEIEQKAPKDLDEQARETWVEERTQEFLKEEERVKNERAQTDKGKLEGASEEAAAREWELLEELIGTIPLTPRGLAALQTYVRTQLYVRDQVLGVGEELSSPRSIYTHMMERIACAAAGLPEPPEHDLGREDDEEEAW